MWKSAVEGRRRSSRVGAAFACALAVLLLAASAASADSHYHNVNATDCYVDGFNYKNNGDYTVEKIDLVFVTTKFDKSVISGKDYPEHLGFNIYAGGSTNMDLNALENVSGNVPNSGASPVRVGRR